MTPDFSGRVAVVSGSASGIGAALVRSLKQAGAAVEMLDLAGDPPVDVSDEGQVEAAVGAALARHGHIDLVFSNAGRLRAGPTESFAAAEFDRMLAVNLRGAFLLARASIPALRATHGAIVFTASTSALVGAAGEAAYAASKAGLVGFMRSLAAELAPDGVRVNAVAPGWVDTPFNNPVWDQASDRDGAVREALSQVALGRQARPDEIVGAMLFLAGPEAAYLTGQVIAVDGGLSTLR